MSGDPPWKAAGSLWKLEACFMTLEASTVEPTMASVPGDRGFVLLGESSWKASQGNEIFMCLSCITQARWGGSAGGASSAGDAPIVGAAHHHDISLIY